jgi:hypothetical protein
VSAEGDLKNEKASALYGRLPWSRRFATTFRAEARAPERRYVPETS